MRAMAGRWRRAACGRVRWRRFALLFVPSLGALAVLAAGMAQGALPASFAVSGRQAKVAADEISGQGFALYPAVVTSVDGRRHPVMVLAMRTARVRGLCHSTSVRTPLGRYVLRLHTRPGEQASRVDHLVISATTVDADVDFGSLHLNRDASTLDAVPGHAGAPGAYGLQSLGFTVRDVRAGTWLTTGGSFQVSGLRAALGRDVDECF
ncbi:DUF6230 family protein [Spirillospora sp. CA-255316]